MVICFVKCDGDRRVLHVLTPSFPSRRSSDRGLGAALVGRLDAADSILTRDRQRLEAVKRAHAETAASYFAANAASWDRLRSLHVPEEAVEAAIRKIGRAHV